MVIGVVPLCVSIDPQTNTVEAHYLGRKVEFQRENGSVTQSVLLLRQQGKRRHCPAMNTPQPPHTDEQATDPIATVELAKDTSPPTREFPTAATDAFPPPRDPVHQSPALPLNIQHPFAASAPPTYGSRGIGVVAPTAPHQTLRFSRWLIVWIWSILAIALASAVAIGLSIDDMAEGFGTSVLVGFALAAATFPVLCLSFGFAKLISSIRRKNG